MNAGLASLRIVRARARGVGRDRLRAQLMFQRLAGGVDTDRILGPAAILVARRAQLRLPAHRRASARTAFEEVLHPLVAQAVRPIARFVPADAAAVLFADEAELLVCLARSLAAGALAGQWWWEGLLAGRADPAAVRDAWLARPAAVAPALDSLDRTGEAAAFLRQAGPETAGLIAQALIRAHALHRLADLAADRIAPPAPDAEPMPPPPIAPWTDLGLSAATRTLTPALAWPVVIAVALRRDPARARGVVFAETARAWLIPAARKADTARAPRAAEPAAAAPPPGRAEPPAVDAGPPPSASRPRGHSTEPPRPSAAQLRGQALPAAFETADPDDVPHEVIARTGDDPAPHAAPGARPASTEAIPAPSIAPDAIETRFGGLLFLLNVALALDLWGDFTAPLDQRLEMSPWRWLARVGERLFGRALRDDPLWMLLHDLAGEAAPDPGDAAAEVWRIPDDWLTPFPQAGPPHQRRHGRRVYRMHPAGFPLQIAGPADSRRPDGLVIDAHVRYLRARLPLALGMKSFPAARRLLARPARVWITSSRLDAAFPIDTHPVAIRAAGLDRDPGWIPAAGRDVRYHFR